MGSLVTTLPAFDYGDLDEQDAVALEKHAAKIVETQVQVRRISSAGVIAIGKELKTAQQRLASHDKTKGVFNKWVKQRCGFGITSAYKAIWAWDHFHNVKDIESFEASALYLLSAESCPEEARTKALEMTKQGEVMTYTIAKRLKEGMNGKPRRGITEEQEEEIKNRTLAGQTCAEIGAAIGLHPTTVGAHRNRLQVAKPKVDLPKMPEKVSERGLIYSQLTSGGWSSEEASAVCRLTNKKEAGRTARVAASGDQPVIEGMDAGWYKGAYAEKLLKMPEEEKAERLDKIRAREEKKHHDSLSIKGKTRAQITRQSLATAYDVLVGLQHTYPITARSIPRKQEELVSFKLLCSTIERVLKELMDAIKKEISCLQKTDEQNNS